MEGDSEWLSRKTTVYRPAVNEQSRQGETTMRNTHGIRMLGVCLLATLAVPMTHAATWTATVNGYWTNAATWGGGGPPADGDDAVINSGVSVTVDVSTASLNTFTNKGTLTFMGWNTVLTSTVVSVSGIITHGTNTDVTGTKGVYGDWVPDNRVYIACSNFTLSASGSINTDRRGYMGGAGGVYRGYGPGGGVGEGGPPNRTGGGGYGGRGGWLYSSYELAFDGVEYGSINSPTDPGSGGTGQGGGGAERFGGNGGGAVRIEATGHVAVDGVVSANGGTAGSYAAGGSGGSIWITTRTFAGTGSISASGGAGQNQGNGGAGGRISVVYNQPAQMAVGTVSVVFATSGGAGLKKGQDGTLCLPDALLLRNTVTDILHGVRLFGFTTWQTPALTISTWPVAFMEPHFTLAVTNGNLVVTNGGVLTVAAGTTNAVWTNSGAQVSVSGDLIINNGSWVYPLSQPAHGVSAQFRMGNLVVMSGGGFNADNAGYAPGGVNSPGAGPGKGFCNGGYAGGAGHGGTGGLADATYGVTYGSSNHPVQCGSGGGSREYPERFGGYGGGLVQLDVVANATLNGSLLASGSASYDTSWGGGGGSGGGIDLRCATLDGTNAVFRADAGNGSANGGGGGGGGRIAIWYAYRVAPTGTWTVSANKGTGYALGQVGTLVWGQMPAVPIVDNSTGASSVAYFTATLNGTLLKTGTAASSVSVFWGPTDGGTNKTAWTNTIDFGMQAEGTLLSTNLTGLNAGQTYYYRFYGSNSVGEGWAAASTNFATTAGLPMISNEARGATGLTLTSATLNGSLVSTGTAPTTVSVVWGPTDGGTNLAAWANTNTFTTYLGVGPYSTNITLPASDTTYYYTFYATNAGGAVWATPSVPFLAANVTLVATDPTAAENGPTPTGMFAVYRPLAVTSLPVTVNYTIGGTASNGVDYALLSGNVAIPAGATSNTIVISPILDGLSEGAETVVLTLAPGAYVVGSPSNDTVTIQDAAILTSTWTAVSQGYWTNAANWSGGVPGPYDTALFTSGSAIALIDQDITVGSLLMTNTYSGSVTFSNGLPGKLAINGDLYIRAGASITTPYSSLAGQGTGRIITVTRNATINGAISANGWGFTQSTMGPGHSGYCGSHGGANDVVDYASLVNQPAYGSLTAPTSLGSHGRAGWVVHGGGGAVKLDVGNGTLTVAGSVTANGAFNPGTEDGNGCAGGSVWLIASNFAGSGTISADAGAYAYSGWGAGGRIALYFTNSTFTGTVSARGGGGMAESGTLWCPQWFDGVNGTPGNPTNVTISKSYRYVFPDNRTNYWNLTASGPSMLAFHNSSMAIYNLNVTNGGWVSFANAGGSNGVTALTMLSNITVEASSGLMLPISTILTNTPCENVLIKAGGWLSVVGDTTAINPESGGTAGSRHGVGGALYCRNASILGTINLNSKGFPNMTGPGYAAAHYSSSHGGACDGNSLFTPAYGSLTRPTALGGGGRFYVGGGGAFKLVAAETLQLDGMIDANGSGGGAAGGSVWLVASNFSGGGTITAAGIGPAASGWGSGGRVSLEYVTSTFSGVTTVPGGSQGGIVGWTGSLYRCQSPYAGVMSDGYGGASLRSNYKYTSHTNGLVVTRVISDWRPYVRAWTDTSLDGESNQVNNVVTNILSGLAVSNRFMVTDNGLTTNMTSSGSGDLTIVVTLDAPHTVTVKPPPAGTTFKFR